jgi:parallel beta-helix repeat protein
MDNADTGIDLRGSSSVDIVKSNIIRNKGYGGIYSANPVSYVVISESEVCHNLAGNGINLNRVNWVNIEHSNISGNVGNGIFFSDSVIHSNNIINNCTIAANARNGVYIITTAPGSSSYIENNNIHSNTIYSNNDNGIYLYSYGYKWAYIQNNNFYSNTIYSNNQNGINFYCIGSALSETYMQNNNIYSNIIYSNQNDGIYFHARGTGQLVIQYNNFYSNTLYSNERNGICISSDRAQGVMYCYIRSNNIYSNIIHSNYMNGLYIFPFANSGTYIEDNNIYSNTIYQHTGGNTGLGDALENNLLYWTTRGDADWVVDTSTYYFDGDSARSGDISHDQETILETEVIGPGTLTFYWKVSSGPGDYYMFHLDYWDSEWIAFDVDWHQMIIDVGAGIHTLTWEYDKDDSGESGSDCGWLDKVEYTNYYNPSGILIGAENPVSIWQESHIYNNTIISNVNGIVLLNIMSQNIYTNNISNNEEGIWLERSSSNALRYNDIYGNNQSGIIMTSSSNSNIIENNNIASNNITGIFITKDSNDNHITRNNISYNNGVGVNITDASGNQIHHNNFINNTENAYDNTIALNDWDDGSEGNYWSDYLGTDDDGDGFGEDPYIIIGGGGRDWHPFIELIDITAPYIISTAPAHGAVNVPVDTTMSITFSKEMNKTAVEGAISISGGLTPTGFAWDAANETVTFIPSSNLQSGARYNVTITTDAKDTQGNRIKIPYIFSFTAEDIEAPWIVSTSPFGGEIDVGLNADVVVTFNEPMRPSSVTYTCTPDPFGWSISWNGDNTEATFSHNNFGNQATYSFHIATGKDVAGLDLAAGPVPNPWSFTTEDILGPEIISTSPVHDSQNISISSNVVVSFNEEMDVGTMTYTCSPDPLGWSVIWSNNDKTATFSHDNFTERTVYTFHITGAKDILGNDLNPGAVPNPWSFTTTGDYEGPQITMTSPADNATNVDLDWNVTVTFNEPMDTSSVNLVCIPDPGGWSETWSSGDTVVTYSHNPFENGTCYTCNINTANDVPGNDLVPSAAANPWIFITTGDLVGPQISSTSPFSNEFDINPDAEIVVVFSEAIDPTSLGYMCSPDPGGWSEIWSNGDTVVTLSHSSFTMDAFYTFQITAARDISGNDLVSGPVPNPWSFTTIGDVVPPEIITISPVDSDVDVDQDEEIVVAFSEPMYTPSLTYLCTPDPGGWSESWSSGNTVVTFSHNPLSIGTKYTFHIIIAKDVSMNDLNTGAVPNPWSFTISGELIGPQIIETSPFDSEVDVQTNTDIVVTFSEAMDIYSVNYICTPNPGDWSESWSAGDTVVTFSHNTFDNGTIYNFYIVAGKDVSGNDLGSGAAPNPWSFITIEDSIPPQIDSTSPADNDIDINLDSIVDVTFTEAMDTSTLTYSCTPDPGGWVVSWSNGDTVVTFLHDPFTPGTTYTFHITAGKDLSGNDLTSGTIPHSWSFTTISIDSLTVTPPEVSITVNGTTVLLAQAYDAQNNPVSGITYTWSIYNNLGTIFSQNQEIAIFQASSNTGTCIVNVTAGGKSAQAAITITSEEPDGIEPEESRPEDMEWISFLWLVIITACIVILVVVLWKKDQEEDRNQLEKDATPEELTEDNLVGKEESETEIPPPPPPEETIDESPEVPGGLTESEPGESDVPQPDSLLPPPPD